MEIKIKAENKVSYMRHSRSLQGDTQMTIHDLFKDSIIDPELAKRNKEKLEAAKEYLGEKWLFHPNNIKTRTTEINEADAILKQMYESTQK